MAQFTEQEIAEARWYVRTAIDIRQDARATERRRLTSDAEVLERVPEDIKARFIAAKKLHEAGAYRP